MLGGAVLEVQMGQRVFACESDLAKAGQPGDLVNRYTARAGEGRKKLALQHARFGYTEAIVDAERKKVAERRLTFGGPVGNLKITELAAPAQAHGAGANAAQWKGYLSQMFAGICEDVPWVLRFSCGVVGVE